MISLQEKKTVVSNSTAVNDSIASYARRDFEGAVAIYAEDAEVSAPTGHYVGKLEILSQLKSWKTAFSGRDLRPRRPHGPARRHAGEALVPNREPKADRSVQSA